MVQIFSEIDGIYIILLLSDSLSEEPRTYYRTEGLKNINHLSKRQFF